MSNKKKGGKDQKKDDFKFDFANQPQNAGEKKEGRQQILDLAGKDASMMAQFQKHLGELIGKSSGYLESLPKQVQNRVKALKHLHTERVKLEKKFEEELRALESKYEALYQPFIDRRFDIVSGVSEPKPEELVEEKKEEKAEEKVEEKAGTEAKKEEEKPEEKDIKGVPEFWLLALKHHEDFGGMITERDEEALKHLTDVRIAPVDKSPDSFTIEFHFSANDFFENDVIKKTYVLKENEADGEVMYDHVDSSEIKWKPNKNLTVKKVTRQQKSSKKGGKRGGKGGKGAPSQTITVEEPTESFFHFFNPENAFAMYNGGIEEDEEMDEEGGLQEFLEVDYELGLELKEKIIPHAVMWYTGENAVFAELGSEDEEDDEDDDQKDDDEEEDEEFQPPKETPGQQQNPECKQQ